MNLGRQLKRVRQQADHLFLRSDRTDVVGELRNAEEQVEELRLLCEAYTRALEKYLHTHTMPEEKKHKKIPEFQVAEGLKEGLSTLSPPESHDHQDLTRLLVERVVEVEQAVSMDVVEFEDKVEKQVLGPLQHLIKEDFPSIAKQKKQLKQVGLDVDAAKTRWRSSQANPAQHIKTDTYREELEEAESKLDQARDNYACDIFSLLSRERDVSKYMCGYVELQREFLKKALAKLDYVLPEMKQHLEASTSSPVYGVPLHEHLQIVQQEIAVPIQVCVRRLIEVGLAEEGLFRIAGSTSKVRRLKGAFDANLVTSVTLAQADEHDRDYDVHVVAGALKCYLRELPEPLLTHVLHDQWLEAVRKSDHEQRLRALWTIVNQLPSTNVANLKYIIKFLAKLAANSSSNKMSPSNIAIVLAPNLIWAQRDSEEQPDLSTLGRNMSLTSDYRNIVEILVEYSDYFFKDNVDFGVIPKVPPSPSRQHTAPNGTVPVTAQHNRPTPQTHRRIGSSDLSGRIEGLSSSVSNTPTVNECESPKQPQRTKKKQAPRPPQVKPVSTYGPQGPPNGQENQVVPGTVGTTSASGSPEQTRSNTPPKDGSAQTPAPAARLQHTNSLRRPTGEPPKPPIVAPVKPPRPSPPTVDALEKTTLVQSESKPEDKKVVLGFEALETRKENDEVVDFNDVILRKKGSEDSVGPIGFNVEVEVQNQEGNSSPKTSRAFRQSLESVLQLQAAGQPVALPRHNNSSAPGAGDGDTAPAGVIPLPRLAGMGETNLRPVLPPTPAQRTTIPASAAVTGPQRIVKESNQTTAPDKLETSRTDKPALREKPNLMNRSTIIVDHSKPQIPERPPVLMPQRTSSSSSTSSTGGVAHQVSDSSRASNDGEVKLMNNMSSSTRNIVEESHQDGGHKDDRMQEKSSSPPVFEKTLNNSMEKPQVAVVQVNADAAADAAGGCGSSSEKPEKPPKPEKRPHILPRPSSLTSDQLDIPTSESCGASGGIKTGGSGKFTWPPPAEITTNDETTTSDSTNL